MSSPEPLWRAQLSEIHPVHRTEAFTSVERHLIADNNFEPGSPHLLLARIAVGNYTTTDSEGNEQPGRPLDIYEVATYKGIELSPEEAKSVEDALAATLPRVVRMWGKERRTDAGGVPADNMLIYLNNPNFNHSILTYDEEQALIRAVTSGRELRDSEALTPRQQEVMEAGKRAEDELILHNLKLAVYIAGRFVRRDYEMEDLVQVANEGLIKAAKNAKPGIQARFASFARRCMENEIIRFQASGNRGVRIKSEHQETLRFRTAEYELSQKLGRAPTAQEMVANDTTGNLDVARVNVLRRNAALLFQVDMPEPWKAETPVEEVDPDRLSRMPPRPRLHRIDDTDEVFAATFAEHRSAQIDAVLDTISFREAEVIRMRFGLNEGESQHTLDEIAQAFGVTRERIRQIENKTMNKLRHPSRSKVLKDYV